VLDSSCPVLATVPLLAAGFVKRVKERSDVELIRVTPANRDILADQVHRKLASLF
jgi:nucleoside-triphosphatase THEP1